jgi:hypothetical protein
MDFLELLQKSILDQVKTSVGEEFDPSKVNFDEIKKLYEDNVSGLKNKNSELLGKLKTTEELKKKYESSVDIEEYKRLKEEAEKRASEQEEQDEQRLKDQKNIDALIQMEKNKLIKAQERWNKEKAELEEKVGGVTSKYYNKLKDLELTEALKGVHVGDKFMRFVKDSFLSKAGVELDENNQEKVVFNLDGSSVPLKSYITDWAEKDEAKSVIVPPANTGGGGLGSNGGIGASKKQLLQEKLAEAHKNRDAKTMIDIQQKLETMN